MTVSDPTSLRILAAAWAAIGIALFGVAALWAAVIGVAVNAILLVLALAAPQSVLADGRPQSASAGGGRR